MRLTRRDMLRSTALLAGTGLFSATSPSIAREVANAVAAAQLGEDLAGATVVATFPAGSGPQDIGITALPLREPQWPNAIAARPDGSLAILDTVNRRVCIVRGGVMTERIALPPECYPADLQAMGGRLAVLDTNRDAVVEVGASQTATLPTASRGRVSALAPAGNDFAVVEEDASSYALSSGRGALATGLLPTGDGRLVRILYDSSANRRRATALIGSESVVIETPGFLGSLTVAGVDTTARTYLLSAQLLAGAVGNEVDLVVHRVESGRVAARARVPVQGRWHNPTRAVTITADGRAIAIYPERDRTLLLELPWQSSLVARLPRLRIASPFEALAVNSIGICRTAAYNTANSYYSHSWYCTSGNMDYAACGAQQPAYITGTGWYGFTPYNWGGWVTLSQFDSDISSGKEAGNTSTNCVTCSTGTDCCGFIQRCWDISSAKQNDTGLTNWCTNIAYIDPANPPGFMSLCDMYRLPGQHVRLHDSYASPWTTGAYVFESIGDPGRVKWGFYSWSSLNGYQWCIANFSC